MVHGVRVQSIRAGKAEKWERETDCHIVSPPPIQKANEMKSVVLQGFFFVPIYLLRVPDPSMVSCRVGLPSSGAFV